MYDYSEVPATVGWYEPNPLMELSIVVALVAVALAAGVLSRGLTLRAYKRKQEKAVETIYQAIARKAGYAAAAVGPDAAYWANELIKEVRLRLGPVIDLGGPLKSRLGKLEEAVRPSEAAGRENHGRDGGAGASAPAQINILTSSGVIVNPPTAPAPPSPPPAAPTLSHEQRVRIATGEFAEWWTGEKDRRIKDLREAQKALLTPALLDPPPGTSGSNANTSNGSAEASSGVSDVASSQRDQ